MNSDKTLFIAFVFFVIYNTLVDNISIKIGSLDINVVSSVTNIGVRLNESKNDSTNVTSNKFMFLSTKASEQYSSNLHPDWTTAILCWLALQYRI